MEGEEKTAAMPHSLKMENRESLCVTGVEDVSGFDEELIILTTSLGALCIRGDRLHIERIDLDTGELKVSGYIRELSYTEPESRRSFLGGLFG